MSWHTDRLKAQRRDGTESPSAIADTVSCPTCGASGDDPCKTPSGKVKDTWHAKRGS